MSRDRESSPSTGWRHTSGGALALVLLASAPAIGASPPSPGPKSKPATKATTQERPEISGGYSFVHSGEVSLNGWRLSASYPVWGPIRAVADVSGHYGSFAGANLSDVQVMVGGRRFWRWKKVRPFAQVLVGGVRHSTSVDTPDGTLSGSGTDLALGPGGGADYPISHRWAGRVGLDLLLVHGGGWETDPRIFAGAVYRFGRH